MPNLAKRRTRAGESERGKDGMASVNFALIAEYDRNQYNINCVYSERGSQVKEEKGSQKFTHKA